MAHLVDNNTSNKNTMTLNLENSLIQQQTQTTTGSLVTDSTVTTNVRPYYELSLTVASGKLASGGSLGLFKPDAYVELSVDQGPVHRTEVVKSYSPKWEQEFPLLVTPYSSIHLRVLSKNSLTKDHLIGDCSVDLYELLRRNDGKIDSLSMPFLLNTTNHPPPSTSPANLGIDEAPFPKNFNSGIQANATESTTALDHGLASASPGAQQQVASYLIVVLSGLQVDMSQYPSKKERSSVLNQTSTTPHSLKPTKLTSVSISRLFKGAPKSSNNSPSPTPLSVSPTSISGSSLSYTSSAPVSSNSFTTTEILSTAVPSAFSALTGQADSSLINSSSLATDTDRSNDPVINNLVNEFQSTLPRWSLLDPNGNPYDHRQPPPHSHGQTLQISVSNARNSTALPGPAAAVAAPPSLPAPPLSPLTTTTATVVASAQPIVHQYLPPDQSSNQPSASQENSMATAASGSVINSSVAGVTGASAEPKEELPLGKRRIYCLKTFNLFFHFLKAGKFDMTALVESITLITTLDLRPGKFRYRMKPFHPAGR